MAQAKIKPSASNPENKLLFAKQISQRLREAGMLLSCAIACYVLVALISYNAQDASWSHSGTNDQILNFGGIAGAWIADLLFYLFGFLSFLLPTLMFYNGIILVQTKNLSPEDRNQMLVIRWSGFILTLISGCALSDVHFWVDPNFMPLVAGGILGQITGNYFSHGLGFLGATVLHMALFLAGLTLFTGISWLALIDNTGKYTLVFIEKIVDRYYLTKDNMEGKKIRIDRQETFSAEIEKKEQRRPVKIEPVVQQVEQSVRVEKEKQIPLFHTSNSGQSGIPSLSLLDDPKPKTTGYSTAALEAMSHQL